METILQQLVQKSFIRVDSNFGILKLDISGFLEDFRVMSKSIYSLRISCTIEDQIDKVSNLLNKSPSQKIGNMWCLEVEERESDEYFDFVSILKGNYKQLESIGILREDISIWFLYEYEGQCNMEFLPDSLKKLGENEISLCVSCWNK